MKVTLCAAHADDRPVQFIATALPSASRERAEAQAGEGGEALAPAQGKQSERRGNRSARRGKDKERQGKRKERQGK
jgi:hypothetical protein